MGELLHKVVSLVLDTLYPPLCWECGRALNTSIGLCGECRGAISRIDNYCLRCGAPSNEPATSCVHCSHRRLPFERAVSLFRYDGTIRSLILAHKYRWDTSATTILKHLIRENLELPFRVDAVVPVPQDERRHKRRGYDHLAPLARAVSESLPDTPPVLHLLRKSVSTPPQVSLSEAMRKRNLIRAFEVAKTKPPKKSDILLFDDVLSTGSTVKECAKVLKKCGCSVSVLTLAR